MHFYESERVALFIDGANLYATSRALGFDVDYKKMLDYFRQRAHLVRAHYYTMVADDQEYSSIRPLIDWLGYNGYTLVTKPAREYLDTTGRRKVKSSMDVEIAVDAMRLAESLDHAVIFSGDGDFRGLVAALQQRGTRVTVASTLQTQPAMVSDELRRQADQFLELAELSPIIGRDPSAVKPARARNPFESDVQKI